MLTLHGERDGNMKKRIVRNLLFATVIVEMGIIAGLGKMLKTGLKEYIMLRELSDKHLELLLLLNQWLKAKQDGKTLADYFYRNGINSVAIYGMSHIGQRLYAELCHSDLEVRYAVDKQADKVCAGLQVFSPEENMPEVDAIVVTAIFYFDEIKAKLEKRTRCRIISLEDILYGISD